MTHLAFIIYVCVLSLWSSARITRAKLSSEPHFGTFLSHAFNFEWHSSEHHTGGFGGFGGRFVPWENHHGEPWGQIPTVSWRPHKRNAKNRLAPTTDSENEREEHEATQKAFEMER